MTNIKYALLDTDFVSKMHRIRKDDQNKLIDKIMAMPGYVFYCHRQIESEISRHYSTDLSEWFKERVADDSIRLYDDGMILSELSDIYGELVQTAYAEMMKTACDTYREGYFEEKFTRLLQLDYSRVNSEEFLKQLDADCDDMGPGQNLGELKLYVLFQMLKMKLGKQLYVFCSDDKNARNGIVSIGGARCISVLSAFVRLQKEIGFTREDAEPYIKSYMSCLGKDQTTFRVQDSSKEKRLCKVPCEQVFDEMFSGKIEEMKTGNLKYIQ